ncbi:hypothetical protein [Polyangium sp. 15x6]|uniref:hypothetical protein n=1 Tax=Polyangium sp. 15x6 TaxID=3042687 RepID=UPI00249BF8FE|nr:hypothetical protein [Polyangium sp. 15x6]MDI3283110.1 hypothetical protein [Polyangium sp. 15x6]
MRLLPKTLAVTFAATWLTVAPAFAQAPTAPPPAAGPGALQAVPPGQTPLPAAPTQPGMQQPPMQQPPMQPGMQPQPQPGLQPQPPTQPGMQPAPPTGMPGAQPAPGAQQPAPGMDGQTYAVRLRDLEQRIDELKEHIRRSHTRLSLLSDTILSSGGAGSRANLKYTNELSGAFKITRLLVVLDGAVQYNKTDQTGAIAEAGEIPIFNGSIPPGDHTVQVLVNLQGNGYGVFSYMRGYRLEVRSNHSFTALEGKTMTLQIVSFEKGGVTTPIEERPAVRFVEKVTQGLSDPNAPAGAPAPQGVAK